MIDSAASDPPLAISLFVAEREFLAASVAVWREIDKHIDDEGHYKRGVPATLTNDAELRRVERKAWNRYRRLLDVAALPKGEEGGD